MVLTVLLGTALKFEGKFILQTRSDGPVDMLVADFATPDSVRAYARFDADRLAEAQAAGAATPEALLGKGVLALTVDQGPHMQRYQGIVELDGTSMEEVARIYFRQSEQIPTDVRLGVAKQLVRGDGGTMERWRAGGVLAAVPAGFARAPALAGPAGRRRRHRGRARPDGRFLADGPGAAGHRRGRRASRPDRRRRTAALPPVPRVRRARLPRRFAGRQLLLLARQDQRRSSIPSRPQEITESIEDGVIKVNCEFCSTLYEFDPAEFLDEDDGDSHTAIN